MNYLSLEVLRLYSKDDIIKDVLKKHPEAEKIFARFGIRCFG
jgi:hypothetical protein